MDALAVHIADKTTILPLIKSCAIRYSDEHAHSFKTVRTPSGLENALRAVERKFSRGTDLTVNLFLNFAHWYVDTRRLVDVCDFSIFNSDPFPVPAIPPPVAPAQAANAAAPGANPPALDPGVVTLIRQLDMNTKQYSKALVPPKFPGASTHPFIKANFPQEVQERRTLHLTNYVYHCLDDLQSFSIGPNYALFYLDPVHIGTSFIALDGTYFVLEDQGAGSEKNFCTTANKCSGHTAYDIYNWYTTFTEHCARFSFYCDQREYDGNLDYAYTVSINAIKNNPPAADMPCLVCEIVHGNPPSNGHRFEQCTVLNNHLLLKKQFISFYSTICRSRKALKSQEIKHLQFEETDDDANEEGEPSDSSIPDTPSQDFPPGQY